MGDIFDLPWLLRGWVHQEIAFSRRLLIFGKNLMFMRYGDTKVCENGWQFTSSIARVLNKVDLLNLHQRPFSHFAQDAERFCEKELTYRNDSLPAMATLARQVHRQTGSQYLAGLWLENLANDLLYRVCASLTSNMHSMPLETRLQRLSDPDGLARPSWSWVGQWESFERGDWLRTEYMSTLGVTADDVPWILGCTVLKSAAEPVNENPFGAVRRAYLTIRCQMIELKNLLWAPNPAILTSTFSERSLPGLALHWDTYNVTRDPRVARSVADRVSLICTSQRPNTQNAWPGNMPAGLIVYPAPNDGEYYRIGVWQQHWTARDMDCCFSMKPDLPTRTITLV